MVSLERPAQHRVSQDDGCDAGVGAGAGAGYSPPQQYEKKLEIPIARTGPLGHEAAIEGRQLAQDCATG